MEDVLKFVLWVTVAAAAALLFTRLVAREWFAAKRRHMQNVMNDLKTTGENNDAS